MIYYFSGTGNSRYAAKRLAGTTDEELRFIPQTDAYTERLDTGNDLSVGFVFPIYAWGVPPIVLDFISHLPEDIIMDLKKRQLPVWCVVTCGDEAGMAVEMLRKSLAKRGLELNAAWSVIMPNVYVLLPGFGTDDKLVEQSKLRASVRRIADIGSKIISGAWEDDVVRGALPKIKTALVYPLFRKWGVNTKKWHYSDGCIGCGRCAGTCPVGNISMIEGRPHWGNDCTSCCACYHVCPTRSAQYGKITKNMGQYMFDEDSDVSKNS